MCWYSVTVSGTVVDYGSCIATENEITTADVKQLYLYHDKKTLDSYIINITWITM